MKTVTVVNQSKGPIILRGKTEAYRLADSEEVRLRPDAGLSVRVAIPSDEWRAMLNNPVVKSMVSGDIPVLRVEA